MTRTLRAAVVQTSSTTDLRANLRQTSSLVSRAANRGAGLILVPENFAFVGRPEQTASLAERVTDEARGPILDSMASLAAKVSTVIILGGMPTMEEESEPPQRYRNTSVVLSSSGRILALYNKIHLFDVDLSANTSFQESAHVDPGSTLETIDVLGIRLGLSICYDLRFPELYRRLAADGAQVLTAPSAFTLQTGKDHWEILIRARAIENQAYVLAANQTGNHGGGRRSWGKSAIVDPWGTVVAQAPEGPNIALADLDLDYLEKIRRDLPALRHRRL